MTKPLAVRTLLVLLVLLACASIAQAQAPPEVTVELLNPPEGGILHLDVGESYIAEIQVVSTEPFLMAMVLPDQYYPGRGIFVRGGDRAVQASEVTLYVTLTGKASTADLPAVSDWPEPGVEWPEEGGVAPVSLAVGVRFPGGLVAGQRCNFAVSVP
jgi:hypothetical protein